MQNRGRYTRTFSVPIIPGLATLVLALLWQAPAFAQNVLYGTTRQGVLFTVNTATGAGTQTGTLVPVCLDGITEIEFDPSTAVAFAQDADGAFCGTTFQLPTGAPLNPVFDGVSLEGMEVVAGTWYAATFDTVNLMFATFDPATGVVTDIGPTGLAVPLPGLAWNGTTMYGISGRNPSSLYTINLTTGAATLVGPTGIQAGSLEFGPDGFLYAGGTGNGLISPPNPGFRGNIYRINPSTGAATLVGPTGFDDGITGLLLGPAPAQVIPALGPLALIALAASLAIAGFLFIRIN